MYDKQAIENCKSLLKDYLISHHSINPNNFFNCLNPTHEDRHPSMKYTDKFNKCKCFSCNAFYDIFDIIGIDYNTTSFKEQLQILEKLYPDYKVLNDDKKIDYTESNEIIDFTNYFNKCKKNICKSDYLLQRNIDLSLLEKYNIGFDETKNLIVFPINENCYFARSTINNSKIKSKGISYIWNENLIKESNENSIIYVTESIIDSLSLESIDPNIKTISLNGLPNYKRLLSVSKDNNYNGIFVLTFDNDKTGNEYQSLVKDELNKINITSFGTTMINNFLSDECKDLNEALIKDKEKLKRNYEYFDDVFKKYIEKNRIKKGCDYEL